jgi:hypothetical protein
MREIKVRLPEGQGEAMARLAMDCGADTAIYHSVYDVGRKATVEELRVKTSTPIARKIINALQNAPFYDPSRVTVSSHEIRSLLSSQDILKITQPFSIPASDIYQEFWQTNHVTLSFICRTSISAMLLSYAMLKDRIVLMIGAMFFTMFSPPLMSLGLGLTLRDTRLMRHACKAFCVAVGVSIGAAALVDERPALVGRLREFERKSIRRGCVRTGRGGR